MNHLSVIEQKYVRFEQDVPVYLMTVLVDSESDLPVPEASWSPGSICMIADTHTYKILNSEGEWV